MKFFVSAMEEDRANLIAREIESEDFESAVEDLRELARRDFEGRPYRITSVTEVPELGFRFHGSAVIATGVLHGEHIIRRGGFEGINGTKP